MNDDIEKITEDIKVRAEKFGAYLKMANFAVASSEEHDHDHDEDDDEDAFTMPTTDELKQKLKDGELRVVIFTTFGLNELAFSPRVQNPEQVRDEDEFKAIVPTEGDILKERILDRLQRGLDPLGDD